MLQRSDIVEGRRDVKTVTLQHCHNVVCLLGLLLLLAAFTSIYRLPLQNSEYFPNSLTKIIDHFGNTYDNHFILGDFNLEPTDSALMGFLNSNSLNNLIKTNTCFKGKGSCIGLILTNGKFSSGNLLHHMKRESVITIT